ncbi:MAG: transglycosylase SLT domain-containing protein [Bdellovibrionales bacterium]|nr:transglycosylase SLT domain-containing protein [Bdellovibrionales bacterium]
MALAHTSVFENWAATTSATQSHFDSRSLDMSYAEVLALMEKRMGQRVSTEAIRNTAAQIVRLSYLLGFQPSFILAIIEHESSFRADVISRAGAIGLMQLLPATARVVGRDLKIEVPRGGANLKDPVINVTLGMHYLAQLRDEFQSLASTLAAYNLGPVRWQQVLQQPNVARPKSITRYVEEIERTTRLIREAGHLAWESVSARNRLALNDTDPSVIKR